jgi:uncharacterized membrane protein
MCLVAVALGAVARFAVGSDQPLWIDEVWTGAIVSQATFADTIRLSLLDVNAPAYYFLMYFWTKFFGLSNAAMRFPSIVFGIAAPTIALIPLKAIGRDVRLIWCGLAALWIPGIYYSQEARCYTMAFLLATACTVAFVHLLKQPNIRNASCWALLGSLTIVTQYHALLPIACQGFAYLVIHRERALRTWPAACLFLPVFIWLRFHLPRVLEYADLNFVWQPLVSFKSIYLIGIFAFGNLALGLGLIILTALLGVLVWHQKPKIASAGSDDFYCWAAAGSAISGAALIIVIGIFRPSFTERYLMVFMPGILLAVALLAARFGRHWPSVPVGLLLLYAIFATGWSLRAAHAGEKWNFEHASRELADYKFDRLIFLYDTPPLTPIVQPRSLAAFGSFFFRRDGLTISILPVILNPSDDVNKKLVEYATGSRPAILWVYRVPQEVPYDPHIERIDSRWTCSKSSFGKGVGVVSCQLR